MKKKIDMMLVSTSLVCLLPLVLSAAVYDRLPDMVATHWGPSGIPDGFMPKGFAAFGIPLLLLALNVVLHLMLENDPKRRNASAAMKALTKWAVPVVSLLAQTLTVVNAVAGPVDIQRYVPVFTGLLITVAGNYLPKCKQNYTVGIRLPWTLHSEDNWNRTHRFAGYVWVAGGLLLIANAFLAVAWLYIVVIAVLVVLPALYSFLLYRRSRASGENGGDGAEIEERKE